MVRVAGPVNGNVEQGPDTQQEAAFSQASVRPRGPPWLKQKGLRGCTEGGKREGWGPTLRSWRQQVGRGPELGKTLPRR